MKKIILLGITLIMITTVFAGCTDDGNGNGNGGEELETAPNFSLTDIDGNDFKLSDYRGKVVILDFMATWCNPCIDVMDDLKDIFANYDASDVVIMSIDKDEDENDSMLRDFKESYGDDWIYAVDYDNDVDAKYNVTDIPVTVIVNKEGKIAYRKLGYSSTDYETLTAEIDKLL
jgi:peroxiredoxin